MEDKYFRPAGDLNANDLGTESKYFKPAGDLDDGLTTGGLGTESKYFKSMGDLSDDKSDLIYPKTEKSDSISFRTPEEIVSYFRTAENLNDKNNEKVKKVNNNEEIINKLHNNIDKINDYLLTVVSGKKYDSVCELGVLMGAGRMIVGLEQLMKMVDEGYNIVSARVINAERNMIEIEFQRYIYDEEKMERWRRF